jgi:hypothetical protein
VKNKHMSKIAAVSMFLSMTGFVMAQTDAAAVGAPQAGTGGPATPGVDQNGGGDRNPVIAPAGNNTIPDAHNTEANKVPAQAGTTDSGTTVSGTTSSTTTTDQSTSGATTTYNGTADVGPNHAGTGGSATPGVDQNGGGDRNPVIAPAGNNTIPDSHNTEANKAPAQPGMTDTTNTSATTTTTASQ